MLLRRTAARRRASARHLKFATVALLGFVLGELLCGEMTVAASGTFAEGARELWLQCTIRLAPLLARA